MSNAQASLVQSAFYCAYLVMPLPVSIVMNKLGYRNAVLCGLVTYGVGAMPPAEPGLGIEWDWASIARRSIATLEIK